VQKKKVEDYHGKINKEYQKTLGLWGFMQAEKIDIEENTYPSYRAKARENSIGAPC